MNSDEDFEDAHVLPSVEHEQHAHVCGGAVSKASRAASQAEHGRHEQGHSLLLFRMKLFRISDFSERIFLISFFKKILRVKHFHSTLSRSFLL